MGTLFGGGNSAIFILASPLTGGQLLKEKILLLEEHINSLTLLLSEKPKLHTILAFLSAIGLDFWKGFVVQGCKQEVKKVVPLLKMAEKIGDVP